MRRCAERRWRMRTAKRSGCDLFKGDLKRQVFYCSVLNNAVEFGTGSMLTVRTYRIRGEHDVDRL